jgi:hypothetical protein
MNPDSAVLSLVGEVHAKALRREVLPICFFSSFAASRLCVKLVACPVLVTSGTHRVQSRSKQTTLTAIQKLTETIA